jgi:hypothetical protein
MAIRSAVRYGAEADPGSFLLCPITSRVVLKVEKSGPAPVIREEAHEASKVRTEPHAMEIVKGTRRQAIVNGSEGFL